MLYLDAQSETIHLKIPPSQNSANIANNIFVRCDMKVTHFLTDEMSVNGTSGRAACGLYVNSLKFGDSITDDRQDVTCGNCKRTRVFNEPGNQDSRNQQRCSRCNKIVGCNYEGKKHRCNCEK